MPDGGEYWDQIVSAGSLWSKGRGLFFWGATYFTGPDTGFTLGGEAQVFETRDRGKTWTKLLIADRITHLWCVEGRCRLLGDFGCRLIKIPADAARHTRTMLPTRNA